MVESLAHGGRGVARTDGYVLFVQGAIPGDRVRARVFKRKRSYGEARVSELLEPAPDRIEPRAPHPGAPWQVLPYERQLEEKQRQVVDALERIGGFEGAPVEPIVPAVEQWRYRNKMEYSFGEDADGQLVLGFHPPGQLARGRRVEEDVLASARDRRAARARPRVVRGGGAERVRPRDPQRLPAQPRGARGPRQRAAPGHGSSRARATSARRTSPRRPTRTASLWSTTATLAEVTRDAETAGALGGRGDRGADRARCASASRPTPSSRRTPRWPSASTRSRPSSPG